jgi:hypothetical protein
MEPIFTEHPLTKSEQADLISFLNASIGQPVIDKEWLVIRFMYRGRLRGVRKALVEKGRLGKS